MPTLRQIADGKVIQAYGTSESVKKAWDTRGRGRKAKEDAERARVKALPDSQKLRILPVEEADTAHPPVFVGSKRMEGMPPKGLRQEWKEKYDAFGPKLMEMHKKLDDPAEAKTTAGKFMHFLKDIAEWHDAWGNLRDLILEVGAAVYASYWIAHKTGAVAGLMNTLFWGHAHLAPVMHHLANIASMMGSKEVSTLVRKVSFGEHGSLSKMAYDKTLVGV